MSLKEAYRLAGASNPYELFEKYSKEDQRLMQAKEWDYNNPALLVNQIKKELEEIDYETLSPDEAEWWSQIMWFWHHHAVSCAIWRDRSREKAEFHAVEALCYVDNDANQITWLLFLLIQDEPDAAAKWVKQIRTSVERVTAKFLINEYRAGNFF